MAANSSTTGEARPRTPIHLWIVGVLSLLWNVMGAFDYSATQLRLDFYLSQFTEVQMDYFTGLPAWAVAGWAFGVWGAFVGSILLLARRSWAVWSFGISIAGLAVTTVYNFVLTNGAEIMGTGGVIFSVIIWIVAILLVVYARRQSQNGVLV